MIEAIVRAVPIAGSILGTVPNALGFEPGQALHTNYAGHMPVLSALDDYDNRSILPLSLLRYS
ncbi:hypothetical protein IQ286_29645 [Burkholderia sp. R-69749]|nr:hypothetical protein [Burkholderia sp. R-69749]